MRDFILAVAFLAYLGGALGTTTGLYGRNELCGSAPLGVVGSIAAWVGGAIWPMIATAAWSYDLVMPVTRPRDDCSRANNQDMERHP